MNPPSGGGIPPLIPPIPPIPPIPSIDPLVRPRGLQIVVPQGLVAVDMPSHLPKRNLEQRMRILQGTWSGLLREWPLPSSLTTVISWVGFLQP